MALKFTLVQRHGRDTWDVHLGPDATANQHRAAYNALRNDKKHRGWKAIAVCTSQKVKRFNRETGQEIDSSSSASSSSSSSSSSTLASNTSSSSSGHSSSSSSTSSANLASSSSSSS